MVLFLLGMSLLWKRVSDTAEKNSKKTDDLKNNFFLLVIIGFVIGFSQYYYIGSNLIPVMAIVYFGFLFLTRKISFSMILISLITSIIVFAPQGAFTINHPDTFLARFDGVSILADNNVKHTLGEDAALPKDLPELISFQFKRNIDFFISSGDRSAFYYPEIPTFDILTRLFFWLGLGISILRLKQFPEIQMVSLFLVGLIFAGLLTIDAPNGPRLLTTCSLCFPSGWNGCRGVI